MKHRTQSTNLETQNTEYGTLNTKHKARNTEPETRNLDPELNPAPTTVDYLTPRRLLLVHAAPFGGVSHLIRTPDQIYTAKKNTRVFEP